MKTELSIFGLVGLSYIILGTYTTIYDVLKTGTIFTDYLPFSLSQSVLFLIITLLIATMGLKLFNPNKITH